jgi:hypothetical protein
VNSTQPFVALNYALNVDRDFHAVPWRTLEGTVFAKHYRPAFPHHHFGKTSASFMSKRASALIDNFRMWHAPAETDQLGLVRWSRTWVSPGLQDGIPQSTTAADLNRFGRN